MVKYYGRARQRIGSVNTNQLGLKMSGCPSRVGRNPVISRYIKQRVNCMQGTCGPIQIHGVNVPSNKFRNNPPYCKKRSTTCLAAAGGIGNIKTPYYRTPAPGEKGCGCKFGSCDGGFVLKAGGAVVVDDDGEENDIVGYISPSFSSYLRDNGDDDDYLPPFGSLMGGDGSPIKNKDIFSFIVNSYTNDDDDDDDDDSTAYEIVLKATPEVKKYLASKVQSDCESCFDGDEGFIYNIILNINGKEYPNCGGGQFDVLTDAWSLYFSASVPPLPQSSVPPLKQGETYNFSFK